MAHTKAKGSSKLGRDSQAKRLGVKLYGRETVRAGGIIVRQKGTKYRAGKNVKTGRDWTLYAECDGVVNFKEKKIRRFNNKLVPAQVVSVEAKSEGKK